VNLFFIEFSRSLSPSGCGQEGFSRGTSESPFLRKLYGSWVIDTTHSGCSEDSSKSFVTFQNSVTSDVDAGEQMAAVTPQSSEWKKSVEMCSFTKNVAQLDQHLKHAR
jgi:hypothetical protein